MVDFQPGDRVRILTDDPAHHYRTPAFLRGKVGVIERVQGQFYRPEDLAYGRAPKLGTVYRVLFRQHDLWSDYSGRGGDGLTADLFDHWLTAEGTT